MATRPPDCDGRLILITGCMYSGKSERLINLYKRLTLSEDHLKPLAFSCKVVGDLPIIKSRAGGIIPAILISEDSIDIFNHCIVGGKAITHDIFIDEGQFFDEKLPAIIETLTHNYGINVTVAALNTDFQRHCWPVTTALFAIADEVVVLHACCKFCGEDALFSLRHTIKSVDTPTEMDLVVIDTGTNYSPVCRSCYIKFKIEEELGE